MASPIRMLEPLLKTWDRAGAFQYLQRFHRFAEICGCDTPTNRTDVKKAVLFATMDLDLETFITQQNVSLEALESISRMECPVLEPDKTMQKVNESMPKRIISASKRLRMYFSLTETLTCRGCVKRKRCKLFRKSVSNEKRANVSDVSIVLFGLGQYCRYFLQDPATYPPIAQDFSASLSMLDHLEVVVRENQRGYYGDLPIADQHTARQALIHDAKGKLAKQRKKREERILNLPEWMRESVLSVNPKNLSVRQKQALLAEHDAKENPTDWVMEGDENKLKEEITEIDDVRSIPLPKRFEFIERAEDRQAVENYSTVYKQHVKGVYRVNQDPELDLDEVPQPRERKMEGGYSIVDMLDPRNFKNLPAEALDAIQVAPQALHGVHYYNTNRHLDGASPLFDTKVIQEMWSSSSNFDPPFLSRIPFDTPRMRSGGALPPSVVLALSDEYKRSHTPATSSTAPVDFVPLDDDLDAPPKERVEIGSLLGRVKQRLEDDEQRVFDDPWATIPPRKNMRMDKPDRKDDIIELPQRNAEGKLDEREGNKRPRPAPQEEMMPRKPLRGQYDSLRRGVNDPGSKAKNFEFSKAKGRAGLYFPGEELPKKKTQAASDKESSSAFPEVPTARSRLRQAKLGNIRGLVREKEEDDSALTLQRMINKKLKEKIKSKR